MSAVATLPLYILPASHDVTVPASQTDLAQTLQQLRDWIWQAGYTPFGPPLLSWDTWATREVRQPIASVFARLPSGRFQLVERPALLVVSTSVSVRAGKVNLAGVYDRVRQHGLDPLGAPLIPLGAIALDGSATVEGFVPVVPRGTRSLIPIPGWYSVKMGWSPPAPAVGVPIPRWRALQHSGLLLLRTATALTLLGIVLSSLVTLAGWLLSLGLDFVLSPNMVFSLSLYVGWGMGGLMLISGVDLWRRLRAIRRWNTFWAATSTPPTLQFEFAMEE